MTGAVEAEGHVIKVTFLWCNAGYPIVPKTRGLVEAPWRVTIACSQKFGAGRTPW